MLEEALGVNRSSVYAEFGSKQALFDVALEHYRDTIVHHRFGPLREPGAGLDSIVALFTFYGTAGKGPAAGKGCLLCNTAIELGADDPSGTAAIPRYFEQITSAFESALTDAARNGELAGSVDAAEQAHLLTATILGIYVLIRADAPPHAISAAASAAVDHVAALASI
jgi:TetR/AcrR family transcriptional repressor of nem operon